MPTVLILGASRGIGHELVRQYRADGWRVLATARKQGDLQALRHLGAVPYLLDVTNADSIGGLAWNLDGEELDLAVLVAGIYGPPGSGFPTQHEFDSVMHTNVLAAMRLLPIVAPMVAARRGKLVVLSSDMASLALRKNNIATLYRASKAALNSVLKDASLAYGPDGVTCVAMHPGWVQTDMGGPGASLRVEESVASLRRTISGLDASANGAFLNHDGTPLPW
jgi:NAD(P)-dependent dehydrogenase (short-subunit alcohol dehydrogenase family)